MSDCVLHSQSGAEERERIFQIARDCESKMPPIITQFCEFHGAPHAVETPVDLGARQMPAIPQEALDPIKFKLKPYCSDCGSYHGGPCSSPGRAVKLGMEQWEKKGIDI